MHGLRSHRHRAVPGSAVGQPAGQTSAQRKDDMIGRKMFGVMVVLAVTVGSVAGIALGVVLAVASDRARSLWEPIDWDGVDD